MSDNLKFESNTCFPTFAHDDFLTFFHFWIFRSNFRFPDLRRCPGGGFRCVEFDFEVENQGKQAPEVKKEEKPNFQNFEMIEIFKKSFYFF